MRWLAPAFAAIATLAASVYAADDVPSVSFSRFPLEIVRTHTYAGSGTPADKAELVSPFPNDFPPSLTIGLETGVEAEGGGRFLILGRNYLRVYNVTAVKTAPYKTIAGHMDQLEKLLTRRSKRGAKATRGDKISASADELPDYPPRNAGHLVEAKLTYVDGSWGAGILYVTQFVQGIGESPNNQQLTAIFQGISKKRHRYISADLQITHPAVPARPEDAPDDTAGAEALTAKVQRLLDAAPEDSFTPSLRAVREWLAGIQLDE